MSGWMGPALASGVATALGTPSSANLKAAVTDETGSGALVFATSPTLVTPVLGTPTSGNLVNTTGTVFATSFVITSTNLTTTPNNYNGEVVDATVGCQFPFAVTLIGFSVSGHCSALGSGGTMICSVWNTNQTAGSQAMTVTTAALVSAHGIDGITTTEANSGKATYAANTRFFVTAAVSASTATIQFFSPILIWRVG